MVHTDMTTQYEYIINHIYHNLSHIQYYIAIQCIYLHITRQNPNLATFTFTYVVKTYPSIDPIVAPPI